MQELHVWLKFLIHICQKSITSSTKHTRFSLCILIYWLHLNQGMPLLPVPYENCLIENWYSYTQIWKTCKVNMNNMFLFKVMFLYLWPAIVFYGIKDKVVRKVQKLFKPFFTQWQSSRTKRKREIVLQGLLEFWKWKLSKTNFIWCHSRPRFKLERSVAAQIVTITPKSCGLEGIQVPEKYK